VGKRLWLRATDSVVTVYQDFQPVAIHARSRRPGERRTVTDHLPPEARTFFAHDRAWCLQQAAGVGPACARLIERLLSDRVSERLRAAQGAAPEGQVWRRAARGGLRAGPGARQPALPHRQDHPRRGHDLAPAAGPVSSAPYAGEARFVRGAADLFADEPLRFTDPTPLRRPHPRSFTMNPATELAPQLKQLRLSGILDSLDARNRQAIDAKLAYTEFLALLIQDEVARREQKKFATRLRRAAFRATKTLEGFEFDRLPSTNRALVHDLATGRYIHEKAPVLIVGPCGTGKSHLAQALGHCAVRQGQDVVFASCAQLLASLNAARAIGNYERKLQQLARVPLLIIDDFGLKPLRAPADEDLHDLIAERYEQAATVVTSNLDFTEWDQAFPGNRLLASATVDRLRHNAYCLTLDGASYRAPRQGPNKAKTTLASTPKNNHS
jgi:DNA replication protein DnaC